MATLFSIHEIHHTHPKTGERAVQPPGAVFECNDEIVDDLLRLGAAREPDERELALHKLSTGRLVEAPAASGATTKAAPIASKGAKPAADDNLVG